MADDSEIRARLGSRVKAWVLSDVIGVGAMGAVYSAVGSQPERVAVKVMHAEHARHQTIRKRFEREAKIIAAADHPQALDIYAVGEFESGEPYYVMELVEADTLKDRWRSAGRVLDLRQALECVGSLLNVLAAYHAAGIVHRDIKPSNVLVVGTNRVRLVDFGIARFREEVEDASAEFLTRQGATIGTPGFMSPEQAMGRVDRIDVRSDLFCVGALLYALVSGRKVHEAATSAEALLLAGTRPPDSVKKYAPELPPDVVRFIDKAVSWYPNDRYQSAREMRDDLEVLLLDSVSVPDATEADDAGPPTLVALKEANTGSLSGDTSDRLTYLARLRSAFQRLEQAYISAAKSHWRAPGTTTLVELAYDEIAPLLRRRDKGVSFHVQRGSFSVAGETVWEPPEPLAEIPVRMHSAGFRRVRFLPTTTRAQFSRFFGLMGAAPEGLAPEDGLVSALWDLRIEPIDVRFEAGFLSSGEDGALRAQKAADDIAAECIALFDGRLRDLHDEAAATSGVTAEALTSEWGATDAVLAQRALRGQFTTGFRQQFERAMQRDRWDARVAWVLAESIREASAQGDLSRLEPLARDLVPSAIADGDPGAVLLLVDRVVRSVADRDALRTVAGWVFDERSLGLLSETFSRVDVADLGDGVLSSLRYIRFGADEVSPMPVLRHLDAMDSQIQAIFLAFVDDRAPGNESSLADAALKASGPLAKRLIEILADCRTPASGPAISRLMEHPDPGVRDAAVENLARVFPDRASAILAEMMKSPEAGVRVRALQMSTSAKNPAIVDSLQQVALKPSFHDLPYTERRLVLETIFKIDPAVGEEVCVDILTKRLNITRDKATVHTTRVLAVGFLAEHCSTPTTLEAIREAARRWPGNPSHVRDAARAVLQQLGEPL